MLHESVSSRAIAKIGYDTHSQVLEVEFRTGRVYRYRGVPAGVHEFLRRSASKGSYFNRMIDGHYPHEDITPAAEPMNLTQALKQSLRREGATMSDKPVAAVQPPDSSLHADEEADNEPHGQ